MIVFAIVALFAAAVFLSVKYLRINAGAPSRKAMEREAGRRADMLRSRDSMITCDYCGAKFDSSINSVCPMCGAAFSRDEEWLHRYEADQKWVLSQGDRAAEQALRDARRDSAETAARLKKVLVILGSLIGVFLLLAIAAIVSETRTGFARSEKLNEYSFDNYTPCEYQLNNGGVIFSHDGLTVTATFYESYSYDTYDLKIGYRVQNESDRHKYVNLDVFGVNGLSEEYMGGWLYGTFRKNSDVTVYGHIYDWEGGPVREIVFGDLRVEDGRSRETLYKGDDPIRMTTSAPDTGLPEIPDGTALYSSHGVDVILLPAEPDPYEDTRMFRLWIHNGTEYDYLLTAPDITVNGQSQDSCPLYKEPLPAGYAYMADRVYALSDDWDTLTDSDRVELSLSFSCREHPEGDFSTGYLCLQGTGKD